MRNAKFKINWMFEEEKVNGSGKNGLKSYIAAAKKLKFFLEQNVNVSSNEIRQNLNHLSGKKYFLSKSMLKK